MAGKCMHIEWKLISVKCYIFVRIVFVCLSTLGLTVFCEEFCQISRAVCRILWITKAKLSKFRDPL